MKLCLSVIQIPNDSIKFLKLQTLDARLSLKGKLEMKLFDGNKLKGRTINKKPILFTKGNNGISGHLIAFIFVVTNPKSPSDKKITPLGIFAAFW